MPRNGHVYFLSDNTAIKIGWTELETKFRVDQLQTGNPRQIVILAEVAAEPDDEKRIHAALAHARGIGEWFAAKDPLVRELVALASTDDTTALWERVASIVPSEMRPKKPLSFGQRIRMLRLKAGLSQPELAKRAGVSSGLISHYETGRVKDAAPDTARLLAGPLGISPAALLFGESHA